MAATNDPVSGVKTALLIIDLQEDFCPPNGSLAVDGGRDIAPIINDLLRLSFDLKIATRDFHPDNHISFATQHMNKKALEDSINIVNPENPAEVIESTLYPPHCIQDTPGSNLIPELDTSLLHHTLIKGTDAHLESFSAFGPPFRHPPVCMTDLAARLESAKISRVICVGIAFDVCVKCTAVDAVERGLETWVVRDACRGVNQDQAAVDKIVREYEEKGVRVVEAKDVRACYDEYKE